MFRGDKDYPGLRLNYKLGKIEHFVKMRWPQQSSLNLIDNASKLNAFVKNVKCTLVDDKHCLYKLLPYKKTSECSS